MISSTNALEWETTPSDNSHLFDYPVQLSVETKADLYISLPRSQCMEYINDGIFLPFESAGIEIHCRYTKE